MAIKRYYPSEWGRCEMTEHKDGGWVDTDEVHSFLIEHLTQVIGLIREGNDEKAISVCKRMAEEFQ